MILLPPSSPHSPACSLQADQIKDLPARQREMETHMESSVTLEEIAARHLSAFLKLRTGWSLPLPITRRRTADHFLPLHYVLSYPNLGLGWCSINDKYFHPAGLKHPISYIFQLFLQQRVFSSYPREILISHQKKAFETFKQCHYWTLWLQWWTVFRSQRMETPKVKQTQRCVWDIPSLSTLRNLSNSRRHGRETKPSCLGVT